ncbi:MAG: EAL domain-containing protein [Thermomonas sp.]
MKPVKPNPRLDNSEEISALIETLHDAEQRLDALTAGEVDTVSNRAGRTMVLQRAQEHLRQSEAVKQAAILNALPAHIALLDSGGGITSVNLTWQKFARENALLSPKYGVGMNYLEICDRAQGKNGDEAQEAAVGLRSVLAGASSRYSLEYPCHSPSEQRWFQMTVAPVAENMSLGAVVMHLDITEKYRSQKLLSDMDQKYRTVFKASADAIMILDENGFSEVNDATLEMFGCNASSELLGKQPGEVSPRNQPDGEDSLSLANRHMAQVLEKGNSQFEWMFRRMNGSEFLTDILLTAMELDGTRVVQATVRDITLRKAAEEELTFKNTMLQTQIEASLDAVLVVDREARIISYNRNFISMWQISSTVVSQGDYMVLQSILDQIEDPAEFASRVQYLYEHPDLKSREEIPLKDGRVIDRYSAPMMGVDDKYYGRVWYFRDITQRKAAEARIKYLNRVLAVQSGISSLMVRAKSREELFREACDIAIESGGFRMAMLGVVDPDTQRIVPVASAGADDEMMTSLRKLLDSSEPEAKTLVARVIKHKQPMVSNNSSHDAQLVFREQYTERGICSVAILPLLLSGESIGALALFASEREFFHDEEVALLTQLTHDIVLAMEHLGNQEKLRYLAYYDALTRLPNRSLFLEHVAECMRNAVAGGHKMAIGLMDLERFKSINDSLGRATGDALLKQVAEWMTQRAGNANLLARIDADHFAVVLPEVRSDGDLARLIGNLLDSFQGHSFRLSEAAYRVGFKAGIALFPDDGTDADTLFKNAEAALKLAKARGDRYLFHTQEMTVAVAEKLALENELRRAIDNEEFVLHYQPKVDLVAGTVTGAEALIRWDHPQTGLVPPGRFIPILEQTGLIHEVGQWALRQAITDYLRWCRAGLPGLRIAVNVSPLQLRNHEFIAQVEEVVGSEPGASAGLELEITESLIMEDVGQNIAILKTLRAMGITVAIDDFGTGYSSLSHLARLPVDTLKIDRCFVTDMAISSEGLALVSTVITLAHSMKLKVVAEGVETEEQKRLLQLLGCDEMQGFLYSKAVPADEFEARFLMRQTR